MDMAVGDVVIVKFVRLKTILNVVVIIVVVVVVVGVVFVVVFDFQSLAYDCMQQRFLRPMNILNFR